MSHYSFVKSTKDNVQKIRQMYKDGNNVVDIGRALKIHYSTVLYWLGRLKRKPKDYENIKNLINERRNMEDENINKGKSYGEYADDELKKKLVEEEKAKIYSEVDKKRLENNRKIKERLCKINSN